MVAVMHFDFVEVDIIMFCGRLNPILSLTYVAMSQLNLV